MAIDIKISSDDLIEWQGKQYKPVAIRKPKKGAVYLSTNGKPRVADHDFFYQVCTILKEVIPPYRTPTDEDARLRPMAEFWDRDDDIARFQGTLVAVKREGAGRRFVAMDVATCGLSTWIHCRIPND